MFDTSVLARLAGRSGGLRAAGATRSRRIIRAGEDTVAAIEISVVSHDRRVLQIESADPRIVGLDRRAVVVDFGTGAEFLRLNGSLEVLSPTSPFSAALHPVTVPDGLQRRRSVRVPRRLIVRVAMDDGPPDHGIWHTTTTCDLSAGGVRLISVGNPRVGQRIRIVFELAAEPLEVAGTVLDVMGDGTSRVRFVDLSESDGARLHRLALAAQTTLPAIPGATSEPPRLDEGQGPV